MQDKQLDNETVRELWAEDVSISGDRLKNILEALKWDLETFYGAYRKEISGVEASVDPTSEEIEAVERFEETGDYDQLLFSLGTSHSVIGDSIVSRVIMYRLLPH